MDKLTPQQFIELLKILHCMNKAEFFEMMGRYEDDDPGQYMEDKFSTMNQDMFYWLCHLDPGNQHLVFEYAMKKAMWNKLST